MAHEITGEQIGQWEKPKNADVARLTRGNERLKFLIGGILILAAVGYLVVTGMASGARYYITVDQLLSDPSYVGKEVRISGAVLGDTIQFDSKNLLMDFTIVSIPEEYDNLAVALHDAVNNDDASRVSIHIEDQPKPDLLQHEAQAILTGKLGENGTFYASELLLKCPSRFEEAEPGADIVDPQADQHAQPAA
jgi:cytochrome c-type biogenesis protein CcmE